jgi:hypothetical protein
MVERLSLNRSTFNSQLEEQLPAGCGFMQTLDGAFFLISTSGAFGPENFSPPRRNQTCRIARVSRVRHYSLERR